MNVFGISSGPASAMTNVLLVLTLPEPVRMQYFDHVEGLSRGIRYIELADTASTGTPAAQTVTAATELAQAGSTAPAPSWPTRPVKVIVSQAAGGAQPE